MRCPMRCGAKKKKRPGNEFSVRFKNGRVQLWRNDGKSEAKKPRLKPRVDENGYSNSWELAKLFKKYNNEVTSSEDDESEDEVQESPYKVLPPSGLMSIFGRKFQKKKRKKTDGEKEEEGEEEGEDEDDDEKEEREEDQPCSSQQAFDRSLWEEPEPEIKNENRICKRYKSVKFSKSDIKRHKRILKRKTKEDRERTRKLILQGHLKKDKEEQILADVLEEQGIPGDTVICCVLCQLLIPNNMFETHFKTTCKCPEKFVHSECAMYFQREKTERVCEECGADYIYLRPILMEQLRRNRLSSSDDSNVEEDLPRRRFQIDYEHKCCICHDTRKPRQDRLEKLDSTLVKACWCNVTAHNQCLAEALLTRRTCWYCNYEFEVSIVKARLGRWKWDHWIPYSLMALATVAIGVASLFFLATHIIIYHIPRRYTMKTIVSIVIVLSTFFLTKAILGEWKRRSLLINENCAVVIKPFKHPNEIDYYEDPHEDELIRKKNRKMDLEEVPFEMMERMYPGRTIQRFLQNWDDEEGCPKKDI